MDKQALLRALQVEIQRHDLGTFMDEPQSGRGVVVPEAFEHEPSVRQSSRQRYSARPQSRRSTRRDRSKLRERSESLRGA